MYPCERQRYNKIVGKLLPRRLAVIFSSLGFEVTVNPVEGNGVDLWICRNNELVLVAEVLNWSVRSRLSNKRKRKILDNLSRYECNRLLVHSVPNSNVDKEFAERGVDTLCIGFQLLPWTFYKFFEERGQVIRRKPVCPQTVDAVRRVVRLQLARILQREVHS